MGGSFTSLFLCLSVIFEVWVFLFQFFNGIMCFVMGKELLIQATKS